MSKDIFFYYIAPSQLSTVIPKQQCFLLAKALKLSFTPQKITHTNEYPVASRYLLGLLNLAEPAQDLSTLNLLAKSYVHSLKLCYVDYANYLDPPTQFYFTNKLDFLKAHIVYIHHKAIRKCSINQ